MTQAASNNSSIPPQARGVSACIITLNEERNIARCLQSVAWAEERLVVDSGSTDRTVAIARELGAKVVHHDWPGWVEQKQFAVEQARHDWILSLDADEHLDTALAGAIAATLAQAPGAEQSFALNRLSEYHGRWMRHGGLYPDWNVRLFHRGKSRWGGINPHDKVITPTPARRLDGHLLHHPYRDLSDELGKLDRYTSTLAREMHQRGKRATMAGAALHGGWAWLRTYLLQAGFLDGTAGALHAAVHGGYTFMKYAKLWELQHSLPTRGAGGEDEL